MKKLPIFLILTFIVSSISFSQTQFSNELITDQAIGVKTIFNADMNNDGNIDIVYAKSAGAGIYWIENSGTGNFATEHTVSDSINEVDKISVADINGDNDNDIIAVSVADSCLIWYENINQGDSFIEHVINNNAKNANRVITADINQDNYIDIIYLRNDTLCMHLGNGNGTFQPEQVISSVVTPYDMCAVDIDEDNHIDLLCADYWHDQILWLENDGSENFTEHIIEASADATCSIKAVDINGDGSKDILATIEMSPGQVVWYENLGNGNFGTKNEIDAFSNVKDAIAYDFDHDGDKDVIAGGYNYLKYFENTGANSFNTSYILYSTGEYIWGIMSADFNNDGNEDFITAFNTADKINYFKSLNNPFCTVVNYPLNGNANDISGNNFNGTIFHNPSLVNDRFGNSNSAYSFDTASYLYFDHNNSFGLEEDLSYSAWVNIDTLINDTSIFSYVFDTIYNGTTIFGLAVIKQTNELILAHDTAVNSPEIINTNFHIYPHTYYHIVVLRDDANKLYKLYINNHYINEYPYQNSLIDISVSMRAITVNVGRSSMAVDGIIDDVIFYNCLIDTATIDSLYHIGGWLDICENFSIDSVETLDAICGMLNGSGEVYASGGSGEYSYQWSNGSTDSETDSLSAGTNSIIVTDTVYGCSETYYFSIQNIGAPNIVLSSTNIDCYGNNTASVSSTVTGGNLPYAYNWSTGEHTTSIQDLYAGTYELTVVDGNGCIASQSVEITQPEELELSFTTTNSTCNTNDGTATVNIDGGTSPYTILWNTGSISPPLTGVLAGAYSVTITDNNGCTAIGSAMISDNGAPTITIDSIVPGACNTNGAIYVSISDTVNSPNYEWDGLPTASEDLLTAMPDFTHVLTVHDGNCTAMQDIYVDYILPETQEICIVTVDTSIGANLIVWEKPVSTEIAGYEIYRETSIPDEFVEIGYTPYDSLGVYVDSMAYPWIRSYKYKIATKDMCGMFSEMSSPHKTIHVNLNVGYISNTVNLIWDDYEGFPYTSFNILRFDVGTGWNDVAGSPIPNTLHSITADVLMTTSMFAITVDKPGNACQSTKTSGGPYNQSISNIDDYEIGTIIESVKPHDNINIYPNPAKRFVIIELENSGLSKISIHEITGKVLISKEFNTKININTKDLTSGIYIIKIETNNQIFTRKLVIE